MVNSMVHGNHLTLHHNTPSMFLRFWSHTLILSLHRFMQFVGLLFAGYPMILSESLPPGCELKDSVISNSYQCDVRCATVLVVDFLHCSSPVQLQMEPDGGVCFRNLSRKYRGRNLQANAGAYTEKH